MLSIEMVSSIEILCQVVTTMDQIARRFPKSSIQNPISSSSSSWVLSIEMSAESGKELGLPKSSSSCISSLRQQLARTTLRNVRSKGHTYVDLREDNKKKPVFFCVLCLSPCHSDSVLHDHLRGNLHKKMYQAAKSTLLKDGHNPWPFNDGMLFFHTPTDDNQTHCLLTASNPDLESNLLDNNSLAIVTANTTKERYQTVDVDEDSLDDENGYHLIIPDVLYKDKVSDLEVSCIGLGKIAARFFQKDGFTKGIQRIWCEWLGDCHPDQEEEEDILIIPEHDFAIVLFAFDYDMGRKGLLDDMLLLPSSYTRPALEQQHNNNDNNNNNEIKGGKKRKSFSDPEDISESLSNHYESSGEEYPASRGSSSNNILSGYVDNSIQSRLIPNRSVRKELRVHRRLASERVCDICQHKMLPGKDVATLLNMKTGRIVCSSRNLNGAFHVFHISCLIHWVLFCEYEVYTKQLIGPKVKKRSRRKKGAAKVVEAEEIKKQIYSPFCPECQGTGIDIDGDELEKPTVSLSEMFKYKMKASDGHREYMKCPEMLQNCSTGFYFPPQSEETLQEKLSPLKIVRFYRATE